MPRFNIDDYDFNHVMHCKNKYEAEVFAKYLDSVGQYWNSGRSYVNNDEWTPEGGGTCYRFTAGLRGQLNSYLDDMSGTVVLEFDSFKWSEEASIAQSISYEEVMLFQN